MSTSVDIAIWTYRWSPFIQASLSSIARCTRGTYGVHVICEPGKGARNINRALDRSRARYLVLVDEDVQFLHSSWLPRMLTAFERRPDLGLLSTTLTRSADQTELAAELMESADEGEWGHLAEFNWVSGHVQMIDRERLPALRADEKIPRRVGAEDTDLGLQVEDQGFVSAVHLGVCVYHVEKRDMTVEQRKQYDIPMPRQRMDWDREQFCYLVEKWGSEDKIRRYLKRISKLDGTEQEEALEFLQESLKMAGLVPKKKDSSLVP